MLLGYFFIKNQKILSSWMMLVLSILLVYFVFLHQHPIIKMLTIIATTFTSMKVIAASQSHRDRKLNLTFNQWMVFACGWAGMQAQPFEKLGNAPLPDAWPMIRFGISRLCAGVLLILIVHVLSLIHI